MSDDRDDDTRKAGLWIAFGTVALVVSSIVGYAVIRTLKHDASGTATPAHVETTGTAAAGKLAAAGAAAATAAQDKLSHAADTAASAADGAATAAAQATAAAADSLKSAAASAATTATQAASAAATSATEALDAAAAKAAAGAKAAAADATSASADVAAGASLNAPTVPAALVEAPLTSAADGKVYFATAKATPQGNAAKVLAKVAKAAKDHPKLYVVVSGFHDPSGNAEANAKLAKERAVHVKELLVAQGVAADRVVLRKPEVTTGSGPKAEARRVELRVLKGE